MRFTALSTLRMLTRIKSTSPCTTTIKWAVNELQHRLECIPSRPFTTARPKLFRHGVFFLDHVPIHDEYFYTVLNGPSTCSASSTIDRHTAVSGTANNKAESSGCFFDDYVIKTNDFRVELNYASLCHS